MIPVKKLLKDMKYLVTKRDTIYCNQFPYNCGFIHANGATSYDCIGLWKTYINNPETVYKKTPYGFYVKPGLVVPDGWSELDLLNNCTHVQWGDFSNIVPGSYLYMEGHAGIYVGDLFGKDSAVNVIECTTGWGVNGVCASWIDLNTGARRDMHRGNQIFSWEAHGRMSKFIDYSTKRKKTYKQIAKEVIEGKWGIYPLRKRELEKAGYNYEKVQKMVNEMLK